MAAGLLPLLEAHGEDSVEPAADTGKTALAPERPHGLPVLQPLVRLRRLLHVDLLQIDVLQPNCLQIDLSKPTEFGKSIF